MLAFNSLCIQICMEPNALLMSGNNGKCVNRCPLSGFRYIHITADNVATHICLDYQTQTNCKYHRSFSNGTRLCIDSCASDEFM